MMEVTRDHTRHWSEVVLDALQKLQKSDIDRQVYAPLGGVGGNMKMIIMGLETMLTKGRIENVDIQNLILILTNILRKGVQNSPLWTHANQNVENMKKIGLSNLQQEVKSEVQQTLLVPRRLFDKLMRLLNILFNYIDMRYKDDFNKAFDLLKEFITLIEATNGDIEKQYSVVETGGFSDDGIDLSSEGEDYQPKPAVPPKRVAPPKPPRRARQPAPEGAEGTSASAVQHRPYTPPPPLQQRPGGRQRLGSDYEDPDEVNKERAQMTGAQTPPPRQGSRSPSPTASGTGSGTETDPREDIYAKVQKKKK
ncbi:hypothetical protein EIN_497110 [Entamoeba invadens IP1]|uniref:Uncharacterized protein n=1 Tax=Entamoeba invadens IP1 TaxID=370355 RepID=A0A0A1TZX1_ENTIV|nr:hypothetical protein EIN_497110 [Entamoeba invadens IP1]ELP87146.1 hypothetical protein EIN_497110 [Entamoeba invadens IP1]|eukprot:XP_004253917.1 hypothetical protein EIN_497110 [Entamoeba invadens IP1]